MATSQLYKLSALSTPAGLIPSLMSREINAGLENYVLRGDGKISPQFRATMTQTPAFSASTVAIAAALTAFGSGFYSFSAATTMYMAKLVAGGGLGTGAVHSKISGNAGVIIARKISAQHGKESSFDFDGYFLSIDGLTSPWTFTNNVALPSMPVAGEAFTLGTGSVNGSALGALKSFDLTWNFKEIVHASNGELWPSFCAHESFSPVLTIKTADPTLISALTVSGIAQGTTPSTIHLQKLAPAGRVPAATAQHIRLTLSAGFWEPGAITENDEGETEIEATCHLLDDGTNSILGVSLASAMV